MQMLDNVAWQIYILWLQRFQPQRMLYLMDVFSPYITYQGHACHASFLSVMADETMEKIVDMNLMQDHSQVFFVTSQFLYCCLWLLDLA